MKKIIIFILLFLLFYKVQSQPINHNCTYNWTTENVISAEKIPSYSSTLRVKNGEKTTIGVSFSDIDSKKIIKSDVCPKGAKISAQGVNLSYRITFSITQKNAYASFSNVNNPSVITTDIIRVHNDPISNVISKNPDGSFQYEALISIWFFDAWNTPQTKGDKVKVTYTITDESQLPNGDSGDITDDPITGSWTFVLNDKPNPTVMVNLPAPPNSANDTWYHNTSSIDFRYAVGPDINNDKKSDYEEIVVREELTGPFADGLFTVNDLRMGWKDANAVTANFTEQQLVDLIFIPPFGSNYSWQIGNLITHQDALYKPDSHGRMQENAFNNAINAFTRQARIDGKPGYKINQVFFCGNTVLNPINPPGNLGTTIHKKLIYYPPPGGADETKDYLKKIHNF